MGEGVTRGLRMVVYRKNLKVSSASRLGSSFSVFPKLPQGGYDSSDSDS